MMDYFGEASETDYFENKLSRAKEKIKEFPTLHGILGGFDQATKQNHYENVFLNLAGADTNDYDILLMKYEDVIKRVLEKTRKNKRDLFYRLRFFGESHFQKISELDFYIGLLDNEFISKEIIYEESGQNQDFHFSINGTDFNLELTGLGQGQILYKINGAFRLAAQDIMEATPKNTLLKINIITSKLGEIGEGVEPLDISKRIVESFNKIKEFCFACRNDSVDIERNIGYRDKSLFDCKDYFYYPESQKRIFELLKSEQGISYLKNTPARYFIESPIDGCLIFDGKAKRVTIDVMKVMPSSTETLRKKSLIEQIKRMISSKLKKGQLKGKTNSIIAVNFEDFAFHKYYDESDLWGQGSLMELSNIVQSIFVEEKEMDILGAIFYYKKLKDSQFIQNPNIKIDREIIDKIGLLRK